MDISDNKISLIEFLNDPSNKRNFIIFYKLCYAHVYGFLTYQKRKGYYYPDNMYTSNDGLSDMAVDILGALFRNDKSRKFNVIYDYYKSHNITEYSSTNVNEIYDLFKQLVNSFTRQELSKLKKAVDPQIDNLKRRIKSILKSSDYAVYSANPSGEKYIRLSSQEHDKNDSNSPIEFDSLLDIAREAYYSSKNRVEWCFNIFETITDEYGPASFVKFHELIKAMIQVNVTDLELYYNDKTNKITTDITYSDSTLNEKKNLTLKWVKEDTLSSFVINGRLDDDLAERILQAVDNYLSDLLFSSGTDALPLYFREVMPDSEHKCYLDKYKYIFETTIRNAEDYLKKII